MKVNEKLFWPLLIYVLFLQSIYRTLLYPPSLSEACILSMATFSSIQQNKLQYVHFNITTLPFLSIAFSLTLSN